MLIRVLGPAEVIGTHAPAPALERRARELLTLLTLRAPDVVSTDELTDLLWDAPPPSAMKSIQSHLSRVRTALDRGGAATMGVALQRRGAAGYALTAGPRATDVARFVEQRSRGRALLRSNRPDEAAVVLLEARSLWRGELELPSTVAAASVASRWAEERRLVVVEHLGALVEGAQPGAAVPELEALTAADPLDEGLARLLVNALHRIGRQADALRASATIRAALVEVGLEPGAALRDAEAAVHLGLATPLRRAPVVVPTVRYAPAADGNVAFVAQGTGPTDIALLNPGVISIDALGDEPRMVDAVARLARSARVLCLDRRGVGLSDPARDGAIPQLDHWVRDLEAVLDAAPMARPVIVASSDAGLVALAFAARHPDRARALVLVHGYARYLRGDDYPFGIDPETARSTSADSVAPEPSPGGFDPLSSIAPSVAGDAEFRRWWDAMGRRAASPATAAALHRMILAADVRDLLPDVQAPVLLVHRRSCSSCDIGHGRYLLQHLPDARLEVIPGADELWFVGDTGAMFDHVEAFLRDLPR